MGSETTENALIGKGYEDRQLTDAEVRALMTEALAGVGLDGKRVLILIPDITRTAPIPLFFRLFHEMLSDRVASLDYIIALGTHRLMSEGGLHELVGVKPHEWTTRFPGVGIANHRWDLPDTFVTVGTIQAEETERITQGMLSQDVNVTINRKVLDCDLVIICGPVFPHEVVGFSGGNKYLFPGIGGPEVINLTHWLGALITSLRVIGRLDTPVRALIDRAASFVEVPKVCFALVVTHQGLAGLYAGTPEAAWQKAAMLSAKRHIVYVARPFKQVLSIMPRMYDDLWTAAKGMYKVEPVIADGGEVIIYAPHISEISYTHGDTLDSIGYHVRDYFVKQWGRFREYPWGVLAHSTHLRGAGEYDLQSGVEYPRIRVTLASGIPRQRCEQVHLGYLDPATIDVSRFERREDEGILVVHRAGEYLYRLPED
jgi:nickel-dependent lactate racemase